MMIIKDLQATTNAMMTLFEQQQQRKTKSHKMTK